MNEIILERYKKVIVSYPVEYGIEYNTSFLIYSLVRLLKPIKVAETGVANGHSTFFYIKCSREKWKWFSVFNRRKQRCWKLNR